MDNATSGRTIKLPTEHASRLFDFRQAAEVELEALSKTDNVENTQFHLELFPIRLQLLLTSKNNTFVQKRNVFGAIPLFTYLRNVGEALQRKDENIDNHFQEKLFRSVYDSLTCLISNFALSTDELGNNAIHYSLTCTQAMYEYSKKPENDIFNIMQLFISKGIDINKQNSCGLTPLAYLLLYKAFDFETIDILIREGANLSVHDNIGRNCLHLAACVKVFRFKYMSQQAETINSSLKNDKDIFGRTSFHYLFIHQTSLRELYEDYTAVQRDQLIDIN